MIVLVTTMVVMLMMTMPVLFLMTIMMLMVMAMTVMAMMVMVVVMVMMMVVMVMMMVVVMVVVVVVVAAIMMIICPPLPVLSNLDATGGKVGKRGRGAAKPVWFSWKTRRHFWGARRGRGGRRGSSEPWRGCVCGTVLSKVSICLCEKLPY